MATRRPSYGHTGEVEASSPQGEEGSGSVRTSGMLMARRIRTSEEKEARKTYARQVRKTLRDAGVPEMLGAMVENEHSCGCPLFWDTERGWNWKCAHCKPHSGWNGEVREQIALHSGALRHTGVRQPFDQNWVM